MMDFVSKMMVLMETDRLAWFDRTWACTRLYYHFHDVDTAAAFSERTCMESLVREIGDRGKVMTRISDRSRAATAALSTCQCSAGSGSGSGSGSGTG